jgi:hypothetical protein
MFGSCDGERCFMAGIMPAALEGDASRSGRLPLYGIVIEFEPERR